MSRLAKITGSQLKLEMAPAEIVLGKLEEGKLDLVLGEFHATSPWDTRVTFIPELTKQAADGRRSVPAAAARNGENGWIALLHRHANVLKVSKP